MLSMIASKHSRKRLLKNSLQISCKIEALICKENVKDEQELTLEAGHAAVSERAENRRC